MVLVYREGMYMMLVSGMKTGTQKPLESRMRRRQEPQRTDRNPRGETGTLWGETGQVGACRSKVTVPMVKPEAWEEALSEEDLRGLEGGVAQVEQQSLFLPAGGSGAHFFPDFM